MHFFANKKLIQLQRLQRASSTLLVIRYFPYFLISLSFLHPERLNRKIRSIHIRRIKDIPQLIVGQSVQLRVQP